MAIGLLSCQKAQRDEDTSTVSAEDVSLGHMVFSDAYKIMREVALQTAGVSDSKTSITTLFGCEAIKSDTNSDPMTITIDFKYIGCQGLNMERYGRLVGEFYGKFPEVNSAMDLNFSNYYFGDYEVNGKVRVIFKGDNSDGNAVNSFYVQGGSLKDDNGTVTWTASHSWEDMGMEGDEHIFSVSGNSNGVNRKGNVFFSEIKSPISLNDKCIYLNSGRRELEVINLSNRSVTYEGTSCSAAGVATINGARYPFTY